MSVLILSARRAADDVAFDEGVKVRVVVVDVLVGEDEAEVPVRSDRSLMSSKVKWTVVQAEIEAALADGVGPLRVQHGPKLSDDRTNTPSAGSRV